MHTLKKHHLKELKEILIIVAKVRYIFFNSNINFFVLIIMTYRSLNRSFLRINCIIFKQKRNAEKILQNKRITGNYLKVTLH
jgi:hypothetical protein